ncbi:MAG: BON domain-containing protein [Planctomycetes bacterium]|nr:BON domain-containing protein [Planctomycetota bacterium]
MTRILVIAIGINLVVAGLAQAQFSSNAAGRSGASGALGGGGSASPFGTSSSGFGSNSGSGAARGGSGGDVFGNAQGLGAGGAGFRGSGSGNLLQGMGAAPGMGGTGGLGGMGMGGRGGMGGMGMGMMGGMGRNQFGMFGNMNQNNMNNRGRSNMRIPVKLGFTPKPVSSVAVSQQFVTRLRNLPGLNVTENVSVTMEGRTAILTGTVGSENEKDLIGRLARLEPGISDVQNDLEIAESASGSPAAGSSDSP